MLLVTLVPQNICLNRMRNYANELTLSDGIRDSDSSELIAMLRRQANELLHQLGDTMTDPTFTPLLDRSDEMSPPPRRRRYQS